MRIAAADDDGSILPKISVVCLLAGGAIIFSSRAIFGVARSLPRYMSGRHDFHDWALRYMTLKFTILSQSGSQLDSFSDMAFARLLFPIDASNTTHGVRARHDQPTNAATCRVVRGLTARTAIQLRGYEHENALIDLLKKKQTGEKIEPARETPPPRVVNLMAARPLQFADRPLR